MGEELCLVSGDNQVAPTRHVLPHNAILGEPIKVEVMEEHPKCKKFMNVFHRDVCRRIDLEDRSIVF